MSTLRNTGSSQPGRRGRIARVVSAIGIAALAGGTAILSACTDAPGAPHAPDARAPSLGKTSGSGHTNSHVVSQTTIGDTVTTVFVVGTVTSSPASFGIGNGSRIDFPYATSSICDPGRSTYGAPEWDRPCTAATKPVQVTAKSWVNAQGKLATDFQPALRFVPGLRKSVTLYLRDARLAPSTNILFCTRTACVDEAAGDPSLVTRLDAANGHAYRVIKHFSGYTVTAD